ncbi:MAG TPA: hypothetical protein VGS22_05910 [Thermoanaerobaculia bacterium]|jgi:hypothetical protein|nr:hypothetical protein [Thermoanaerobaculia bacterium]
MKSRSPLVLLALLALLAVALGLACGKASPTAPSGTLLTISASPTRIGVNGTSTISIIGRTATGTPLRSGTELRLATSLGSIEPLVTTNGNGEATATLRADGRQGTATVEVTTGVAAPPPMTSNLEPVGNASGSGSATVTVQIGESSSTQPTLLVSVNPSNIPVSASGSSSTATITVIARNPDNTPVGAGQTVILFTTLGSLVDSRPETDASGIATTRINAGSQAGDATITAILGSSAPATTMLTIRDSPTDIVLTAQPRQIQREDGTIELVANVINSQGQPISSVQVIFIPSRGVGTFDPSDRVFTNSTGAASTELNVKEAQLPQPGGSFTITAQVAAGNGQFLTSDPVTITVQ